MKNFLKILLFILICAFISCCILAVIFKDWVKGTWNNLVNAQSSGVICGQFKVVDSDKENSAIFYFKVTKDKFIVKHIDAEKVRVTDDGFCTSIKNADGSFTTICDTDFVKDFELEINEVLNVETNELVFSFAKDSEYEDLFGEYKLTPNYKEKTYLISSVNSHASVWKVQKITTKEFEEVTTSNK